MPLCVRMDCGYPQICGVPVSYSGDEGRGIYLVANFMEVLRGQSQVILIAGGFENVS